MDPISACAQLKGGLALPNTTILNAIYYANSTTGLSTLGTCNATTNVEVPLCRLQFVVNTSDSSAITAEAWLPTDWNGRFLALGNAGLGGCIDYADLSYGSKLQFATVGSNNGHDGDTGQFFVNPEVLNDFTSRAIHVETVVAKQIVEAYYGQPHNKSYYLGCSTGGRQGTYAALYHPDDFDGIVAGSPAVNWEHMLGASGRLRQLLGVSESNTSDTRIPIELWGAIGNETLKQCDELDGVKDGVITEPDDCEFKPEALLCSADRPSQCLTLPQVETLRKFYGPFYGTEGQLLYPRFDPGAENSPLAASRLFVNQPPVYFLDWMRYVIYNNTNYDISNFTLDDITLMDRIDPGKISTYNGNMSAFRDRGGKFLTFHGRRDSVIASGNSKAFYNLVSKTLGMPLLDSFYRLFLVPGMDHCLGGVGAVNFGQYIGSKTYKSDDPSSNILLALVRWVENGTAPETMTGLSDDGSEQRVLCRYPQKSVWDGTKYICASNA